MPEVSSTFHFLRPTLLWGLVPFALYALSLLLGSTGRSPWAGVIAPQLLARLTGMKRTSLRGPGALLVFVGTLSVLCAAGPAWRVQPGAGDPSQSPLVVVFELSRSMAQQDVSPSRAQRAQLEVAQLLRARPHSPTALVVVAGTAHVLMPLTDDPSVLEPYLAALRPDLMPNDGENFERAAALVDRMATARNDPLAVLVVSDGLPPGGSAAFEALAKKRHTGVVVLGVGGDGLDESSLERLARVTSGEYVRLSFGERDISRLLAAVEQTRARGLSPRDEHFWQDEGPLLALPLVLGIALWFRRGFVLGRGLLVALALCSVGCSPALEGIWLTPDQQARLLFERGHYREAAERFADPRWRGLSYYAAEDWDRAAAAFVTLSGPEALFNLGNAYAEGGKLQSALHAYERALSARPTYLAARKNGDKIRELLHSLQEDTDVEGMKKVDAGNDDDATKVNPDDLSKKWKMPQAAGPAQASQAGSVEEKVWLSRLTTDPAEFLKRKLALAASREEATAPGGKP